MPLSNAEKSRRYRERHPENFRKSLYSYWKKPYDCPCGTTIKTQYKAKHLKSAKHQHMMEYQEMKRKLKETENTESGNSTDESENEYINNYLSKAKYDESGLLIYTDSDTE